MQLTCVICNSNFNWKSKYTNKPRQTCSRKCWNRLLGKVKDEELYLSCLVCNKRFKTKRSHLKFRKTCSRKCQSKYFVGSTPWNKGKSLPEMTGKNNPAWKGDDVKYTGLHMWVYSKLGKPNTCEKCGMAGLSGREIHWANKSGKYKRELTDWIRLCVLCHSKYDASRVKIE